MDKKERKEKVAKKDKKRSAPAVVQDEIKLHDVNPMPQVNMAMPNAETSVPAGSIITPAVNAKKPNAIDAPLRPINNLEKAAKAAEAAKYKTTLDINDYDAVKLRDINPLPTVNVAMPNTETSVGKSIAVPAMTKGERPAEALEQAVKSNAVQSQTAGIIPQKKSISPFSDMLAPQRNKAKQDKTDAVKMQKYYALTDALKSLGHMGGAAVGGAIGGNVLDSAPKVAEYQQSRGYIDAFEKAKNANDRLRELDDYEFKLNLSKKQRDEERAQQAKQIAEQRAYQDKVRGEEQAYKIAFQNLQNEWSMKFYDYQTQIEQAYKDKDFNRVAALKKQMQDDAQAHQIEMQKLQNEGYIARAIATAGSKSSKDSHPITFIDGTTANIPDNYYKGLKTFIKNEFKLDDDEVENYIIDHPTAAQKYLDTWGIKRNAAPEGWVPQFTLHTTQIPEEFMNVGQSTGVEATGNSVDTTELDDYISQFKY